MSGSSSSLGVVGLGYVGLPLGLAFSRHGYEVVGVDVDSDRVGMLERGDSYVDDISDAVLREGTDAGFRATTDYDALSTVDAVAVCVPTPLEKTQRPNLSYLVDAVEDLATVLPEDCTVVLESTVYPRATEEIVAGILEEQGRTVGEDIYVAYSPERIDPGNGTYDIEEIPKVIGGVTEECTIRAQAFYEPVFEELVPVKSATEAELVKLLENTFRTVNIALINELATVAHQLDVDIWDTIDAAATKPFGFMPFYPGPGLGGHCLPIDPLYLSWKAGQHGVDIEFIELADKVNRGMPEHVVNRVVTLLNAHGVPMTDAKVLVLGVAYKADVSDVRESPAFDTITLLEERGASVAYHDPHVDRIEIDGHEYESVTADDEHLAAADIVVVMTDHSAFDVERVTEAAPLVFDTRNAAAGLDAEHIKRL